MGAITTGCTYIEAAPNLGIKMLTVETAATADTGDTIVITFADYGISDFLGITGYVHTTDGEVIIEEAPTTTVSSGVLTITVGGSTVSDKKRVYLIIGK